MLAQVIRHTHVRLNALQATGPVPTDLRSFTGRANVQMISSVEGGRACQQLCPWSCIGHFFQAPLQFGFTPLPTGATPTLRSLMLIARSRLNKLLHTDVVHECRHTYVHDDLLSALYSRPVVVSPVSSSCRALEPWRFGTQ